MSSPLSTKDSLDTLLRNAYALGVSCVKKEDMRITPPRQCSRYVVLGPFVFALFPHDTGNTVHAWVTNDDGEFFEFIAGTYWFSSRYTFNEFKQISGAWDRELNNRITELAADVARKRKALDEARQAKECEARRQEEARKAAFEAQFKASKTA